MKVAIIGGGFTGLSAAHELTKLGHNVTVYEKSNTLGGLAYGFRQPDWSWHLEYAYHHIFTNDDSVLSLAREIGMADDIIISRPKTATYTHGKTYQLDSPVNLLQFSPLSFLDRMRTGAFLASAKLNPFWQPLEYMTAKSYAKMLGGKNGWNIIWEPLLKGKFDKYEGQVQAAWLWARIYKRTPSLGYFRGGFQSLIERLAQTVKKQGGRIETGVTVTSVRVSERQGTRDKGQGTNRDDSGNQGVRESEIIVTVEKKPILYDRVLITTPSPIANKLLNNPHIPDTIHHLHAQTLILETDKPLLPDNIYWLNINDRSFPFLAAVAHTNFMSPLYYAGRHLTYFGNYLRPDNPYINYSKQKLLIIFKPYIKKLSSTSRFSILNSHLFTGPFAQPVHTLQYSKRAPKLHTGNLHVYVANMDSIYPWDRGTNYAVELGRKAAKKMLEE